MNVHRQRDRRVWELPISDSPNRANKSAFDCFVDPARNIGDSGNLAMPPPSVACEQLAPIVEVVNGRLASDGARHRPPRGVTISRSLSSLTIA
jgi:hypothetical protein